MRARSSERALELNTRYSSPYTAILPSRVSAYTTRALNLSWLTKRSSAHFRVVRYRSALSRAFTCIWVRNTTLPSSTGTAPSRYFASVWACASRGRQESRIVINFFIRLLSLFFIAKDSNKKRRNPQVPPFLLLSSVKIYLTGILSMRFWWRPPSKSVVKNSFRILSAIAWSMNRPGITSTLASLC